MPNTYTSADLHPSSGSDFTINPLPDYLRCFTGSGSVGVDLPQVEGDNGDGARVTIRNMPTPPNGTPHDVLVNAFDNEVIEGAMSTLRIPPGVTLTLQGGPAGTPTLQGVFGWERVS